ncbi:Protein preY, mitochondrial [Oryzias melastigma]|uniref:Protein preY, mitochondrial n=1 Tax=Oryzias melastigma TaxID=30732 RepID=A0A3B3DPH0_ORYME|nr:protein preY, mitochondrial [Oryzias melastigma]KAF6737044.1 Protein preY, mitochondrial [Oryzias melastigma]
MFKDVLVRFALGTARVYRHVSRSPWQQTPAASRVTVRSFTAVKDEVPPPFDSSLLEILVCPLSKKPLRYNPDTNELINEELGIAYPIIDGIPNMIPQDARLIGKDEPQTPAQ